MKKRRARLEKMVAIAQLRLALDINGERRANNGLDLIRIEIQGMSPSTCNGNHFLV